MTNNSIQPCSKADAALYVSGLINQPWAKDGRHCWRLVIEVQRDLFGRELPSVMDVAPTGSEGRRLKPKLFAEHDEVGRWREVILPEHGAIALMHLVSLPPHALIHAGVYLALDGGGVVHCDHPQGVVFDSLTELRVRRWTPRWFVPRKADVS